MITTPISRQRVSKRFCQINYNKRPTTSFSLIWQARSKIKAQMHTHKPTKLIQEYLPLATLDNEETCATEAKKSKSPTLVIANINDSLANQLEIE